MKFFDFIHKKGSYILYALIFLDFFITLWIWITPSPVLNFIDKLYHIISMSMWCLFPWVLQSLIKEYQPLRKKFGINSNSKNRIKNFQEIFDFFYSILVFSQTRVMDFMEFNEQSWIVLNLIYTIAGNLFCIVWISLTTLKYRKIITVIFIVLYNVTYIISFIWKKVSYTPQEYLQQLYVSLVISIISVVILYITASIYRSRKMSKQKEQKEE